MSTRTERDKLRTNAQDAGRERDEAREQARRPGLHDDVESWDDTCSCEPEPRWQAVEEENEEGSSS